MAYNRFFPFDTAQAKTLEKLFAELEARIAELEEAAASTPDPTP